MAANFKWNYKKSAVISIPYLRAGYNKEMQKDRRLKNRLDQKKGKAEW